jgi:NAD(P)-dependent dehydrogenase (short-subunit alcohol dehydrogenase family)
MSPTAIVTGASSGIGLAIATVLAQEGYDLTIVARNPERLDAAAEALRAEGGVVTPVPASIGEEADVVAIVAGHRERHDGLDVLVNNAGAGIGQPVAELKTSRVDMQLAVNLRAIILFYREAVPLLRASAARGGAALVVNTASLNANEPQPWLSVYSAAKAGVTAFTESMNKELGEDGIRSTALCPGYVDTPMTDWAGGDVAKADMLRPSDLGEAVRMLLRVSAVCLVPEIEFRRPGAVF